ncbi:MAG: hypothetical protein WAU88_00770 [Candidatus Zixiibacteriota bacterium]
MDNPHKMSRDFNGGNVTKTPQSKRFSGVNIKKIALVVLIVVLLVGGTATGVVLWTRSHHPKPDSIQEALQLVEQLKDNIDLPTDETPSIAVVKDVSKLSDQPFYAIAQNGDKVLVYQKAGKALLYRPSTKKVIEYTPVNVSNKQ